MIVIKHFVLVMQEVIDDNSYQKIDKECYQVSEMFSMNTFSSVFFRNESRMR